MAPAAGERLWLPSQREVFKRGEIRRRTDGGTKAFDVRRRVDPLTQSVGQRATVIFEQLAQQLPGFVSWSLDMPFGEPLGQALVPVLLSYTHPVLVSGLG